MKLSRSEGNVHVVAHIVTEKGTNEKIIRIVHLDQKFFKRLNSGEFPLVNPEIRGRRETYHEIPAEDDCIMNLEDFIDLLNSYA